MCKLHEAEESLSEFPKPQSQFYDLSIRFKVSGKPWTRKIRFRARNNVSALIFTSFIGARQLLRGKPDPEEYKEYATHTLPETYAPGMDLTEEFLKGYLDDDEGNYEIEYLADSNDNIIYSSEYEVNSEEWDDTI